MASDEEVTSLWTSSSLDWSALGVTSEDVGEFLSRHVSDMQLLFCTHVPVHVHAQVHVHVLHHTPHSFRFLCVHICVYGSPLSQ